MMKEMTLIVAMVLLGCAAATEFCLAQDQAGNPPVPCPRPDVDKPHSACPDSECWSGCTDPGYENTSTQAVSASVIYAQCCCCCGGFTQHDIYQEIVDSTGNAGQFPEQQVQCILDWISANCEMCELQIQMAHKGYSGQDPVDSQNVSFAWADEGSWFMDQVKIWVVGSSHLPLPPAPTGKQDLSQELTYILRLGTLAYVHDPDCDIGGRNDNFYEIASDTLGEYLKDYFGPEIHGYLHGVIRISGPEVCQFCAPSLTQVGKIILAIVILCSAVFILARRRAWMTVQG